MKKWMLRLGLYVLGQFILALGVSLSIISGLGVSPASSVALAFSLVTGVEVGNMMILVQGVYFLLQCLFFEREFKLLFFLQLPSAILFGVFFVVFLGSRNIFHGIRHIIRSFRFFLRNISCHTVCHSGCACIRSGNIPSGM